MQPERAGRTRLLTGLRWLFLLSLLLPSACGREPGPAGEAARNEVNAATATATALPSPTPSITPQPSRTATALPAASATATMSPSPLPPTASMTASPPPTRTPSPPPPPTYTPAAPEAPEAYQLQPWSAEMATELVLRLEAYPDTLAEADRGYNDGEYYRAYRPAALAQEEALLRFPDDPASERWRWGLAYNYARSGDARAATLYADLLQAAMTNGTTSAEALPAWFAGHERRLSLAAVGARAEIRIFRLAFVNPEGDPLSGAYFLLREAQEGPRVYPLAHRDAFDPAHGAGLEATLADLTGDGRAELITVQAHRPGANDSFYYTDIVVYDLTPIPPRPLPFSPIPNTHLGWSSDDSWQAVDIDGVPHLRLRERAAERCEAISMITDYVWTEARLRQVSQRYEIGPDAGSHYCLPFIFAAAESGQQEALQFLADHVFSGGPEQADAWRYRLGIYYALAGERERALEYLGELVADPRGSTQSWVREADRFVERYETATSLYVACLAAELCNPTQALRRLVKRIPVAAYALAPRQLRGWGVPVARWGFFDMEGDGRLEQWLLVGNGAQHEIWILLPGAEGIDALFVDLIGGSPYAAEIERLTPVAGTPILRLSNGRERILFTFTSASGGTAATAQPLRSRSANESDNYTSQLLAESQALLWQGAPSSLIADSLETYRQTTDFDCAVGTLGAVCAEYAYTLGLAQALAGEQAAAAATYVSLWQTHPDSPYATIARAKLAPMTTPTPLP